MLVQMPETSVSLAGRVATTLHGFEMALSEFQAASTLNTCPDLHNAVEGLSDTLACLKSQSECTREEAAILHRLISQYPLFHALHF